MKSGGTFPERALRVLAVTNMYPTPDTPVYGSFVASQVASIREAGVDVSVEFVDGRTGPWAYARAIPHLLQVARRSTFDVVHAHYGVTGAVAAFQQLPMVVSFCGDDLLGTPSAAGGLTAKSRIIVRLSQFAARHADAIICKSQALRMHLSSPFDQRRAHVIPNGVDIRRFRPGDRFAARARLGLKPDERLILFPTLPQERRKRADLAQGGVDVLRRRGVGARLWVVYGVPPEQMPDYYQAADCLLLTSDWEGSPNSVKEALCCDLPVVTVDAGDVRQWLALATGSELVARDREAIADALQKVLTTHTRADGQRVRNALAQERIADRIITVYRAAIKDRLACGPKVGKGSRSRG